MIAHTSALREPNFVDRQLDSGHIQHSDGYETLGDNHRAGMVTCILDSTIYDTLIPTFVSTHIFARRPVTCLF
jgi:hypothetical protein